MVTSRLGIHDTREAADVRAQELCDGGLGQWGFAAVRNAAKSSAYPSRFCTASSCMRALFLAVAPV